MKVSALPINPEDKRAEDFDRLLAAITHPIRAFAATTEGEP